MADADENAKSTVYVTRTTYDAEGRLLSTHVVSSGEIPVIEYTYYDDASGDDDDPPAAPPAAASRCPDCCGKGTILLFTSISPCKRCGGSGMQGAVRK